MTVLNRFVAALLCALVSFGCASSKFGRTSDITDVQEFEVDGLKVLLKQSSQSPVISSILFIRGGSSVLSPSKPSVLESFALNVNGASGTRSTPKSVYRQMMLRMGSGIGGQEGRDYSLMLLRSTREHFDTTWKLFAEKVTTPVLDPIEFTNLQKNALSSLGSVSASPSGHSRYLLDSLYFVGHPYGRRTTPKDIETVTLPMMEQQLKEIFVKSRLVLVVVGNVSREEITAKLRSTGMSALPQGNFEDASLPESDQSKKPGVFYYKSPRKLPTNYVVGYYSIPARGTADYYPYMRMRYFLGGNVFNTIRVQHNLAYAPSVDESEWKDPVGVITFETAHVDSAIKLIYEDVDFFQQYLLKQEIISNNVDLLSTGIFMDQETSQSQAEAIGESYVMTGNWRNAFLSPEKLGSVTKEELNRAAVLYLKNFNWLVYGDTARVTRLR